MKGRKPVPTAIKHLRGTTRPDRANPAEPQFPVPGRMLSPPAYLDEAAAAVWRDLGRMLLTAGVFTVVDKYALAMFCVSAGRWMEAEQQIKETSPVLRSKEGRLYQNPFLGIANRAWDQMRKMFGEFGLTPAERSRISALVVDDEPSLAETLFSLAGAPNAKPG